MKRYLILADGSSFAGKGIGANIISTGKLAIQTGNYGYQEALTDPTNAGKILVFTTPMIGNTGINAIDYESIDPTVRGIIANDVALNIADNKNFQDLDSFLKEKNIPAIFNVDTRALVHHLQHQKIMKASIMDTNDQHAFDQIRALVLPKNKSMMVSTKRAYAAPNVGKTVAVIDLGVKHSLLRALSLRQVNLIVLPYNVRPVEIKSLRPDGLIISNGPGKAQELLPTLKPVLDIFSNKLPVLGIGLGFLVLSSYLKLKLVDLDKNLNGINYAVLETKTDKIFQVAMNLEQLVVPTSLHFTTDAKYLELHTKLLAGFIIQQQRLIATAFNPEGAPGSLATNKIFDKFLKMME